MLNRTTLIRQLPICISLLTLGGGAVVLGTNACVSSVVVGTTDLGEGGSGGSGSVVTGSVTVAANAQQAGVTTGVGVSTGGAVTVSALALMTDELPADAKACGLNACSPPNDMLFIELNTFPITCQSPIHVPDNGATAWQREIGIPAAYQIAGTYSLSDPSIYWAEGETLVGGASATEAVTGSGSIGGGFGTLEVISVDNNQIHVKITGSNQNLTEDGDYTAVRCTPLP